MEDAFCLTIGVLMWMVISGLCLQLCIFLLGLHTNILGYESPMLLLLHIHFFLSHYRLAAVVVRLSQATPWPSDCPSRYFLGAHLPHLLALGQCVPDDYQQEQCEQHHLHNGWQQGIEEDLTNAQAPSGATPAVIRRCTMTTLGGHSANDWNLRRQTRR